MGVDFKVFILLKPEPFVQRLSVPRGSIAYVVISYDNGKPKTHRFVDASQFHGCLVHMVFLSVSLRIKPGIPKHPGYRFLVGIGILIFCFCIVGFLFFFWCRSILVIEIIFRFHNDVKRSG